MWWHQTLQYLADGVPTELRIPKNISQTCKGVKKAVRHTVKLDLYRDVLLNGKTAPKVSIPSLMSKHHKIYMIDRAKVSINPFDSKRYWLNAVESVPFGHYSISEWDKPCGEEAPFHFLGAFPSSAETLAAMDDAPMARVRELQKRLREETRELVAAAPVVPNIPGVKFREKKPRGSRVVSMDELRSLRQ